MFAASSRVSTIAVIGTVGGVAKMLVRPYGPGMSVHSSLSAVRRLTFGPQLLSVHTMLTLKGVQEVSAAGEAC